MLEWQERSDSYIMILERPSPCEDLFDFLERHLGTLSENMTRHIMWQVVQAAHMCCQRGVLHRDIKLENLLINKETLEVKLIDFGCGDLLKTSAYTTFCGMYCPSSLQFEILLLQLHILNSISFLTVTNEENLLFFQGLKITVHLNLDPVAGTMERRQPFGHWGFSCMSCCVENLQNTVTWT